jgi:putative ABC transport system permease protein
MKIYNLTKIAYNALMLNKKRALLTMLGIVIGIASVIAMVSLGESSSQSIRKEITSTGTNMIFIMPGAQQRGGVNMGFSSAKTLTIDDVTELQAKATNLDAISPSVNANGQLVYGSNNHPGSLQGVGMDYFGIRKINVASGVSFTEEEIKTSAKVCLIGTTVKTKLFPNGEDPLGKIIRFKKIPLKIIGVLESKGQNQMGQDQDDVVLLPYTTVQKRILAINHVQTIYASAKSEEVSTAAVAEITSILRENHKLKAADEDDFNVRTQAEFLTMINSVNSFLTILLSAIASISLLVGGIGIMNIMYVTVTERTKEIGLRMSIGAQNGDIMVQFLAESTMLSLIGGLIGIALGLGLSALATSLLHWPFIISNKAMLISFVVCAATGIFFGWYPAKKAAALDPIVALRYE